MYQNIYSLIILISLKEHVRFCFFTHFFLLKNVPFKRIKMHCWRCVNFWMCVCKSFNWIEWFLTILMLNVDDQRLKTWSKTLISMNNLKHRTALICCVLAGTLRTCVFVYREKVYNRSLGFKDGLNDILSTSTSDPSELALMDFALFPYLKSRLIEQSFFNINDLPHATKDTI